MDRFFLGELVREIGPAVAGKRCRGLFLWGPAGFVIPLDIRDASGLVMSLTPEAPGFYLGVPPLPPNPTKPRERLPKLLSGSELVRLRVEELDRIVHLECRRVKPSGLEIQLELVVEWLGTRNAAYLIDEESRKVLDCIAHGTTRCSLGQSFELPEPPPGVGPLVSDAAVFFERLGQLLEKGLEERRAVREASGLSPLLADEVLYLRSEGGMTIQEAFENVTNRLKNPHPVFYHSPGTFRDGKARYRLSPIRLEQWGDGEACASFNEGAAKLIGLASRLKVARQRWQQIGAALSKQVKRQRGLLKKLEGDRDGLEDPTQLRRWGEILLAGLTHARRVEGGVEVTDPYGLHGERVRVPLDPRLDMAANADRYFQKARKVKRGLEILKTRIVNAKSKLEYLETLELMLENAGGVEELEDLAKELREEGILAPVEDIGRSKSMVSASLGPRRFVSSGGRVILAGRSARSNEELTFKIAHPEEMWFHAKGSAGAHVILRRNDQQPASPADIEEAAAVAAFYSKSRAATSVEVVYTLRKHVRKIRGAPPGTVRLARHQSIRVTPALPRSACASPTAEAESSREGGSSDDIGHGSSDEKDEL